MSRQNLELADLFNKHRDHFFNLPPHHQKVINAITNCRTEVLGGHLLKCGSCDYKKNAYNSCRNRHCPKCQFLTKVKWVEKRKSELLPCSYFHVVFTVPQELRSIFKLNKKLCYDLLFKTTSETLKEVAKTPKNLGANIGFIGVLHTWSQSLAYHPHVHYIVPTGGLRGDQWIKGRDDFFLSVNILAQVFRAKVLKELKKIYDDDKLLLIKNVEYLKSPQNFDELLTTLASKDWHVYAKKPFAGPEQVINYLGQYTHRIAISNYRILKFENNKVTFKVRNKEVSIFTWPTPVSA